MSGIDWPGLLRWSLQYSDGTSDKPRMSKEKMDFLEGAIREAMKLMKDPHETVKESVETMHVEDPSSTMAALKLIEACIDDAPEVARNFEKVGAASKIVEIIFSKDPAVAAKALEILSFVLPNNPTVQGEVHKLNGLVKLCKVLQIAAVQLQKKDLSLEDREAYRNVQVRAMGCVSGLIRHQPKLEKDFVTKGGVSWIIYAFNSNDWRFQQKALSLARYLGETNHLTAANLFPDLVPSLAAMVDTRNFEETGPQYGELIAAMVATIVTHHGPALVKEKEHAKTILEASTKRLDAIMQASAKNKQLQEDAEARQDGTQLYLDDYSTEAGLLQEVVNALQASMPKETETLTLSGDP